MFLYNCILLGYFNFSNFDQRLFYEKRENSKENKQNAVKKICLIIYVRELFSVTFYHCIHSGVLPNRLAQLNKFCPTCLLPIPMLITSAHHAHVHFHWCLYLVWSKQFFFQKDSQCQFYIRNVYGIKMRWSKNNFKFTVFFPSF